LLDGALLGKQSININYDHSANRFYDGFIKSLQGWQHLRTAVASEAIWYANSTAEVLQMVDEALAKPSGKAAQLAQLSEIVLNNPNGQSGAALANAVLATLALAGHAEGSAAGVQRIQNS
jgi:hypothetical protein